jgi:hypothetical protein
MYKLNNPLENIPEVIQHLLELLYKMFSTLWQKPEWLGNPLRNICIRKSCLYRMRNLSEGCQYSGTL